MTELHFTKGQGTGNDFVLFADPDATVDLTPERIRAIADRRFGVGGDGVIRAVRSEAIPEGVRSWPSRPRRRGSWTTTTPTARSRRCAATASACSPGS